ncbi:MAG: type II secretion system protein, partial [Erysipelotrichia bacterium]|nr:type II secretion system protein [Erysipelotrichia bacterium]
MREERNKTSLNKGFTMAELLIVIAMMTILAAFGFVAVANYQKSLKITEMDDTAREIFVAAQNHLSAANADGTLEQYYTAEGGIKDTGAVQITDRSVLTDCPTIPPAETDRHDFYYLVHLKGDSISADSLLDAVLPFGAIDETVRTDYSYVIEIDAKTASVYSVFYTDSLSVPLTDKEYRIVRSLKDFRQNKTVRKEYKAESQRQIIGYYGGTVAGVFSEGPKLSVELTINNSDTLSAIVKDTTAENTAERLLTLIIEGRQSGVREKFTIESDGSVTGTVLSETAGSADTENLKKAITISADKKTYAITLDDITTRTGHFHDIMPDYIPGEDITVTARLTAGTSKPAEDAKTVNSLFDSIKAGTAENEFTASLASGRHLQNLEPSISSTPVITTANPCYISKAVEIADIDWNDFISDKSVFMSDGTEIEDGQFLSIISSVLYDFNGKGYVISNLNAAANGNNAGLFAEASVKKGEAERSLIIQNVFLMNPHISTEADGGAAGGIAGLAGTNVTIASCGVYAENADAYDAAYISAGLNGSAGGLVGKINQQSDRKTGLVSDDANPGTDKETESDIIYASFAPVRTISKAYAGGLVGSVDGADRGLVIKDSYASGAVNP